MPGPDAYSIDGRTFSFNAAIGDAIPIGSYVRISSGTGRAFLGQVLDWRIAHSSAPASSSGEPSDRISGRGSLLAELDDGGNSGRLDGSAVFGQGSLEPADAELVSSHLSETMGSSSAIDLGELQQLPGVRAELQAKGFGRHTFMCGQSGSGKTYTLGVVLERLLLETDISLVVLDPNSDYINIGSLLAPTGSDSDEDRHRALEARYESIASRIHVFGGDESPYRLRVRFGNLTLEQQTLVLGLDPFEHPDEYNAFIRTVARLEGDEYGIHDVLATIGSSFADDVRRLGLRIENMGVADMSIWAKSDDPPIAENLPEDWRMVVMDLGAVPSRREGSIVAAGLLGFLWEQRASRQPCIIVIDEAHNICPQHPTGPSQTLATEHLIRIAGEGRKYGLYLLLSTQRPDKLHQNVLSQCDNLILMRLNSASDIHALSNTFSFVPRALLDQATGFGLGEGLAAGKIAPDPLLFRTGRRFTAEGGSDVPATWATRD